jgi:hypothetical protein
METVIIPPTFFKDMTNIYIQQLFNKTFEVLREADRLIFCGYSFPDADMHIKYLIKKAEIYKSHGFNVYVVNRHKGKSEHAVNEEISRYIRFFKFRSKVNYTNLSFEEFSEIGIDGL